MTKFVYNLSPLSYVSPGPEVSLNPCRTESPQSWRSRAWMQFQRAEATLDQGPWHLHWVLLGNLVRSQRVELFIDKITEINSCQCLVDECSEQFIFDLESCGNVTFKRSQELQGYIHAYCGSMACLGRTVLVSIWNPQNSAVTSGVWLDGHAFPGFWGLAHIMGLKYCQSYFFVLTVMRGIESSGPLCFPKKCKQHNPVLGS